MLVRTTLIGNTPLLCHNGQLADPLNGWAKKIKTVTAKRQKTDDDHSEIARLEWLGGVYVDVRDFVIPTVNIRRCFQEGAKTLRQGKQITRALGALSLNVPLLPGKVGDAEALALDPSYRNRSMVKVGTTARLARCRPAFHHWRLEAEWELFTDLLDLEVFARIVALAGRIEGLGDNRINGYGRFTAEVRAL